MTTMVQERRRLPRAARVLFIVLGVIAALVIVTRLVLDPVAAHFARKALKNMDGFKGTFSDLHIGILPPTASIDDFKIIEEPAGRWDEPLVFAERAELGILWRKLLSRDLVGRVKIIAPKFVAARQHEKKAEKAPELARILEDAAPVKLDRVDIIDGEVLIAQGKGKNAPKLWLNKMELTARNLATRQAMMDDQPATLNMRARVQRTGALRVEATMNPWTAKPTFTADAALEKLDSRELYAFLADKADLKPESGTINLYVKAKANNGVLKGGVKPMLENIELESAKEGLGPKLKELLADTAIDILSDDNDGRDAVATTIPLRGTLDNPDAQILPTVLGVVRNAFVVGLRSGFAGLPPKTAEKKEGVLEQAVEAFKKDEGPPDAQPRNRAEAEAAKRDDKEADKKAGDEATPDKTANADEGAAAARQGRRPAKHTTARDKDAKNGAEARRKAE